MAVFFSLPSFHLKIAFPLGAGRKELPKKKKKKKKPQKTRIYDGNVPSVARAMSAGNFKRRGGVVCIGFSHATKRSIEQPGEVIMF